MAGATTRRAEQADRAGRRGRVCDCPLRRGRLSQEHSSRGLDGAAMKTWFKRIVIGLVVLVVVAVVGLAIFC